MIRISDERLVWLLGEELPVRVIPARFRATRENGGERVVAPVHPDDHRPLGDLVVDNLHPVWNEKANIEEVHNEQLHHADDNGVSHRLVVSSANRAALDKHLDSVSSWLLARPSPRVTGPQPIYLEKVVAKAVLDVTRSSVADLLAKPRDEMHVDYHDLLGADVAAAVRESAVAALEGGLRDLEGAGVINAEDRSALDSGWLIDLFLRAKAEDATRGSTLDHRPRRAAWLQAHPGSVLTTFGPVDPGHDLSYSFRDIGTLHQGKTAQYETSDDGWAMQSPALQGIQFENYSLDVDVTSGNVNVKADWFDRYDHCYRCKYSSESAEMARDTPNSELHDSVWTLWPGIAPTCYIRTGDRSTHIFRLTVYAKKDSDLTITGDLWNVVPQDP